MGIINSKVHGMLDYIVGLLLLILPAALQLDYNAPEGMIFAILGAAALVYSIFTRYELGLVKVIPFGAHLMLDLGSGILLAASPWLFGFSDKIYLPHVIMGLVEIGAVLMTKRTPSE